LPTHLHRTDFARRPTAVYGKPTSVTAKAYGNEIAKLSNDQLFVLKGEFKDKNNIAKNEPLCLIKSHMLHESDNLCRIITMFEDLALALQQCMQNAVPCQMYYMLFVSKSQQNDMEISVGDEFDSFECLKLKVEEIECISKF